MTISLQPLPTVRIVVTDTNILINLAHIGRLDLPGKLPPYLFVVPEEVVKEVREPAQSQAVQTAISSGLLQVVQLTDPSELDGREHKRTNTMLAQVDDFRTFLAEFVTVVSEAQA
jgi:predicted nucleic acid-binding protein